MAEKPNGEPVKLHYEKTEKESLYDVVYRLISEPSYTAAHLHRIKTSLSPLLPEASRNSARRLLLWSRQGSPLRQLLLISIGAVSLVALTGLLAFVLFLVVGTVNAVIVSLLISLAVAGGFLALFFAFVAAIYIGALSVAIFAISTIVFWATVAVMITTGWIGFFYTAWFITRKSMGFAKNSLCVTGSAISTYSAAWGTRNLVHKDSD